MGLWRMRLKLKLQLKTFIKKYVSLLLDKVIEGIAISFWGLLPNFFIKLELKLITIDELV